MAKDLNRFYKKNLNKPFKAINKGKGSNYDPVTIADKKFEKFIRSKINKKYPSHSIVGEEFGKKETKSDYSWVIDPIDGTRSFVIGNPSWSNLVAVCYKGQPIFGLANFPELNKFYINKNTKEAFLFRDNKKTKLRSSKEKTISSKTSRKAFVFFRKYQHRYNLSFNKNIFLDQNCCPKKIRTRCHCAQ